MRCRLANKQTSEMQKLSVRGSICSGAAKWSTVKGNEALPVWFVFSGGPQGAVCKKINTAEKERKAYMQCSLASALRDTLPSCSSCMLRA